MQKLRSMLRLQQRLNDETNGKGWEYGKTNRGKLINWRRCALLECAELIDSYPWKHWKDIDASADFDNIAVEVVDIWHFILSLLLQDAKVHRNGELDDALSILQAAQNFKHFTKGESPTKDIYAQIETVESLMSALLCKNDLRSIVETFYDVAMQAKLTLDKLYTLYIGKNILNIFRQEHGYKEGTYIKIWNKKEDNVILQEILRNRPDIDPESLYTELEKAYVRYNS